MVNCTLHKVKKMKAYDFDFRKKNEWLCAILERVSLFCFHKKLFLEILLRGEKRLFFSSQRRAGQKRTGAAHF